MDAVQTLLEKEMKDIYDAEKRLTKALPKMVKAAHSPELRDAIKEHLEVTKNQVTRLEQAFRAMDVKAQAKTCAGMKGILEEGEETLEDKNGDERVSDLALVGAARKVEHYEIAAYSSLVAMAESLGNDEVGQLLQENMNEEEDADSRLSELAEKLLQAEGSAGMEDDEDDEELDMEEEEEEPATAKSKRS